MYEKDLKIIQNSLSESVEVPVDEFLTLTEKTTLLLGQASLSITRPSSEYFEATPQRYSQSKNLTENKN